MIPRASQKEVASLPTRAYWAFWKMAIPPAFRWYKDLYRRGGQYRLFRMPSPASEDPHDGHHDLNHYRTPYLHSTHNVRKETILNSERKNTVFWAAVDANLPLGQKLVQLGFLKQGEENDEQKVAKAAEKFRTNYGEDPETIWRFTNHPSKQLDISALGKKNAKAEDKRKAMRDLFESSATQLSQHRNSLTMGNLDDIYHPKFHVLGGWFNNWDHSADSPQYRQARIDQIVLYEEKVAEDKAAGKIKVYRGNPRAQWQVLDDSFDASNRSAAQTAVKDSRAVAFGLPNQKGVSLSQKRRSSLVVEEDHENESYRSLPYASQHI